MSHSLSESYSRYSRTEKKSGSQVKPQKEKKNYWLTGILGNFDHHFSIFLGFPRSFLPPHTIWTSLKCFTKCTSSMASTLVEFSHPNENEKNLFGNSIVLYRVRWFTQNIFWAYILWLSSLSIYPLFVQGTCPLRILNTKHPVYIFSRTISEIYMQEIEGFLFW